MLVDDESISNFILQRMIMLVYPQVQVHPFTSPQKALEQIAAFEPDLLFLDINMPGMNGWAFLEKMKELGYQFPVYVLTSSTRPDDERDSKLYPQVQSIHIKPMDPEALKKLLDHKLQHS